MPVVHLLVNAAVEKMDGDNLRGIQQHKDREILGLRPYGWLGYSKG
jgi:hypothetical protein